MIDVRGTSETPSTKPLGDTTVEAKLDGHVCGSAQVIVIIPSSICGPCPGDPPPSGGGCPEGAERTPENRVLDATTSPAYWGPLDPDQVKLATVWIQWVTVKVCDQFGDPLGEIYSGCCVQEFYDNEWRSINQVMSGEGTYQDPVGPFRQPASPIVDRDSQAAEDWPSDDTLEMIGSGSQGQDIPVRICGHEIGGMARTFHYQSPDCVWIVCPNGTIIVE